MCRQWLKSSCLLLREANSGLKIMLFHFSLIRKLQVPVMGEKGAALHTISHLMEGFSPLSFSLQTCPANVVLVRRSEFSMSCSCALNLSLNLLKVRPTYCSTPSELVTVALYTTLSTAHFPGRGHSLGSRQLHLIGLSYFSSLKTLVLCFPICAFILGEHL